MKTSDRILAHGFAAANHNCEITTLYKANLTRELSFRGAFVVESSYMSRRCPTVRVRVRALVTAPFDGREHAFSEAVLKINSHNSLADEDKPNRAQKPIHLIQRGQMNELGWKSTEASKNFSTFTEIWFSLHPIFAAVILPLVFCKTFLYGYMITSSG